MGWKLVSFTNLWYTCLEASPPEAVRGERISSCPNLEPKIRSSGPICPNLRPKRVRVKVRMHTRRFERISREGRHLAPLLSRVFFGGVRLSINDPNHIPMQGQRLRGSFQHLRIDPLLSLRIGPLQSCGN